MAIKTLNKTKKRISVTTSPEIEEAILALAERDSMAPTTKAGELLKMALELEEDMGWVKVIENRSKFKGKSISHEKAWKRSK